MNNDILIIGISDIHFNKKNLEVASQALKIAVDAANVAGVPLCILGDLHDSKAILRSECISAILDIIQTCKRKPFILVGNHDKNHEKSEENALRFLEEVAILINEPYYSPTLKVGFIPYQSSNEAFLTALAKFEKGTMLFVHQGFKGAWMGEYMRDDSSVGVESVKDYKVISGHYHRHQEIGTVTYIGSPYTISFTEASDPVKGFMVVYKDHTYDLLGIELRRHVIIETTYEDLKDLKFDYNRGDLIWLKVSGNSIDLDKLNKRKISNEIFNGQTFKLEKVYTDQTERKIDITKIEKDNIFDEMIITDDSLSDEQKSSLKALTKEILDEAR